MGASPYYYFVEFNDDVEEALHDLQQRVFEVGDYFPARDYEEVIGDHRPRVVKDGGYEPTPAGADGPAHDTIDEARAAAGPTGTQSILDVRGFGEGTGYVAKLDERRVEKLADTTTPTKSEARDLAHSMMDELPRGEVRCTAVYDEDGNPGQLFFFGYTWD